MLTLVACTENKEEAKDEPDEEAESKEEVFDPEPDPDAKQVSLYDEERINDQEEIEEGLRADYEEGNYAFEDPFIKVDPYGAVRRTAIVMFATKEPVQIKVTVGWRSEKQPR